MKKKEWEKVKELLARPWPYSTAELKIDGYQVSLVRQPVKDMFHSGILGHLTNRVDLIDLPNCEQKFTNVEV